jgi:hypothetical protein
MAQGTRRGRAKYERTGAEGKLTAFESTLHQALTIDSHRPKQGRRSGRLFAQIQARLPRWLQRRDRLHPPLAGRIGIQSDQSLRAAQFRVGEAFQFDWSDEAMVVGGCSTTRWRT